MQSQHPNAARASMLRQTLLAFLEGPTAESVSTSNKLDRDAQLQAHLTEYQAIMTRNTHWLTLQFALFPILGVAIAVLAQMWGQFDEDPAISSQTHRIIIWLAIAAINVIIIAHTHIGWESYNNVVYLERHLRPEIERLLCSTDARSKNAVLGYECYLREQRGRGPKWWEVPGPVISLLLLAGGVIVFGGYYKFFGYLYPWTVVEWYAAIINTVLFVVVAIVTYKMVRRRGAIGEPNTAEARS